MCAGDVALEGAATTFPAGEGGEDRGGVMGGMRCMCVRIMGRCMAIWRRGR